MNKVKTFLSSCGYPSSEHSGDKEDRPLGRSTTYRLHTVMGTDTPGQLIVSTGILAPSMSMLLDIWDISLIVSFNSIDYKSKNNIRFISCDNNDIDKVKYIMAEIKSYLNYGTNVLITGENNNILLAMFLISIGNSIDDSIELTNKIIRDSTISNEQSNYIRTFQSKLY